MSHAFFLQCLSSGGSLRFGSASPKSLLVLIIYFSSSSFGIRYRSVVARSWAFCFSRNLGFVLLISAFQKLLAGLFLVDQIISEVFYPTRTIKYMIATTDHHHHGREPKDRRNSYGEFCVIRACTASGG